MFKWLLARGRKNERGWTGLRAHAPRAPHRVRAHSQGSVRPARGDEKGVSRFMAVTHRLKKRRASDRLMQTERPPGRDQ